MSRSVVSKFNHFHHINNLKRNSSFSSGASSVSISQISSHLNEPNVRLITQHKIETKNSDLRNNDSGWNQFPMVALTVIEKKASAKLNYSHDAISRIVD